ncbi:hypothetical protein DEU29_11939 [Idiomarina aquatica]|uniref:Uncharacterized protein n=1 Tax=Idiomarina aquatica TaxID=1327752 RepID=A0A4R6NYU8_9GAMM|nr:MULTISPECIES: hypothetical protein [Idiomarina]TDP28964.1 hypothetical protein DEU29_11939 [Idiomarina aquatica]
MSVKWIFLLITLLLSACSSAPSIYLNERYLTETDIKPVRTMLSEQGFSVEVVDIPFPNNVNASTLMYSPLLSAEKTLDTVLKTLEQEGYSSVTVIPLKQGNHLYKQNSVGLYLLPPGIKSLAASDQNYAHQYHSESCPSEPSLTLKRDKTFIYESKDNQLVGRWEVPDMPYLRLYSKQPYINFYYRISNETRSDKLGDVDIVTLTPMSDSSDIAACRMVYGVRR